MISHVICAWSVTWSVHDQWRDQCMINYLISAWSETVIFISNNIKSWKYLLYVVVVQSLCHVWLFETPWIAAHQASLSITNCRSLPKLMSIGLVMPSNHLILCRPLLLLPSIFPSISLFQWVSSAHQVATPRVFSNTTVQKHQFFGTQPSSQSNSHIHTWPQEKP